MKVCKHKITGRLLETQYSEDSAILLQNVSQYYPLEDLEVIDMAEEEYKSAILLQNQNDITLASSYDKLREKAYPKIGDQLDVLMKTFKKLKDDGIDIGIEAENWIIQCEAVKEQYPSQ